MGSFLYGQRWNPPGHRVVYLAQHLSLAALEVIVHAATYRDLGEFSAFRAKLDDSYVADLEEDLPANWSRVEPTRETQEIGGRWATSRSSLLLRVPSVVVPDESNYLLNVEHPRFAEVRIEGPLPFRFDPRLERFNIAS